LRDMADVTVEITEEDAQGIKEVDAKLVALAQRFSCHVLTTDYNLNRVAAIQGVRVLNVNELSNAIRPVVLPGEQLMVRVVQPGKERNQGVGYLADGTMIVVENGDKLMGQEVATEVTRVFQTVAGKMIFAAPKKGVLPRGTASAPAPASTPQPSASQPSAPTTPAPVPIAPTIPTPSPEESSKPTPKPAKKPGHDEPREPRPPKQPGGGNPRYGGNRDNRGRRQNGQAGHGGGGSASIEDRIIQQNRQQP
jgi:outer membrane biosynthesis protein TonB